MTGARFGLVDIVDRFGRLNTSKLCNKETEFWGRKLGFKAWARQDLYRAGISIAFPIRSLDLFAHLIPYDNANDKHKCHSIREAMMFPDRKTYSVSEITAILRNVVESEPRFQRLLD